jgi:hypothetical protein
MLPQAREEYDQSQLAQLDSDAGTNDLYIK